MTAHSRTLTLGVLVFMACHPGRAASTAREQPVNTHASASTDETTVVATVVRLFAVGWADAPVLTLEARPDATATLYIPASSYVDRAARCWRAPGHDAPALGERYRFTLAPLAAPTSAGGPYVLHIRIVERGVQTFWSIRDCERLATH